LETLPRSGMTRGGLLWELTILERRTSATGSGLWPTPTTSEAKSDTLNVQNRLRKKKQIMLCHAVRIAAPQDQRNGGALNPTWVEWLMGWPLGWTDLKSLVTDKSRCAQQQLGNC